MSNNKENKDLETRKKRSKEKIDLPFEPTEQHHKDAYQLGKDGLGAHDACFYIRDTNGKPISPNTFRKYLWDDYNKGRLDMHRAVGAAMVATATKTKKDGTQTPVGLSAGIHISKTRMGWSEKTAIELSGPDGGAIEHEHEHTITADEALGDAAEILRLLAEGKAGGHIRKAEVAEDGEAGTASSS